MKQGKPTLGSLLKALRTRKGLTLKEMSERTGIPFSTLSKVEHDRLTLTYDKLQMISERLGVPMAELFAGPETPSTRPEIRGRRSTGTLETALKVETTSYDYFFLSPEFRHKHMIPVITRVKAKSLADFGELVPHNGEEFIYVIEGAITVHTEFYEPLVLEQGQSIYLDSTMGHAYTLAPGVDTALMLSVSSSSQEELMEKTVLHLTDEARTAKRLAAAANATPSAEPRRKSARR